MSTCTPLAPNTLVDAGHALHDRALQVLASEPRLPLPGKGDTLQRWRRLAAVAASDLCLVKVLEAHHDALAILSELGCSPEATHLLHAVWAAEPPDARLDYGDGFVTGTKAWCSGAPFVDIALITAHHGDALQLVRVDMRAAGITHDTRCWNAIGMGRVTSGRIHFDRVGAEPLGGPGDYLTRPGFWHGGAGIAACWFGATTAIAEVLRTHPKALHDPYAVAHLGAIDVGVTAVAAQLREAASLIDAQPLQDHQVEVMRVRASAEALATDVLQRVGRALGPVPLCEDAAHARRCSDLEVFIRQSHAERDWASLGRAAAQRAATWTL
ncbi:MAG: acyl-CoA dehydrogenase [Dyella sp.]